MNNSGQLGIGSNANQSAPVQVGSSTWRQVSAGGQHAMALDMNGKAWAWGYNNHGVIGNGTNSNQNAPVPVNNDTDWKEVVAYYHSLAVKNNGTLWSWGDNYYGQLGVGSFTDKNVPVQVGTATDWAAFDSGAGFTLAIKNNGMLWAWGRNTYGQFGNGTFVDTQTLPLASQNCSPLSAAQTPYNNLDVSLFPNPVSDYVVVDIPEIAVQNAQIEITDLLGHVVLSQKVTATRQQIELSQLPKGAYLLFVRSERGRYSGQLIKA